MDQTLSVSEKKNTSNPPLSDFERKAWMWMRFSGVLVIPLVFIHVLIQDILIGVQNINVDYVAARWSNLGWRVYDAFLLVLAFTHGMNGFRQVLMDYLRGDRVRVTISRLLLAAWLVISVIGAMAIVGGVGRP